MDQDQFIKGFNHGYTLSQKEPELLAKLLKAPNDKSDYFQGLVHGQKEHEKEKLAERLKENRKSKDKGRLH
jgi:hypothetical protein